MLARRWGGEASGRWALAAHLASWFNFYAGVRPFSSSLEAVLTAAAMALWPWTGVTLATAFDTVLIYNSTQANRAISVHTFGAQTVTAGTFTLTMPTNATGTALIQLN